MSTLDGKKEKQDLAHYTALVTAWFNTRLEHDKSLLTLSAAGIGLLISVATKVAIDSAVDLFLYIAALAVFVLCLVTILLIYRQNSKHLEDVIQRQTANDLFLSILDVTAIFTFIAGIVFSSAFGIRIAIHSFEIKETPVSAQSPKLTGDSFNKALNTRPIAPIETFTKSFNGAAKLNPAAQSPQQTTAPAPAPAQSTNASTQKP